MMTIKLPDENERVYAVGDIHGRLDLLTRMMDLIAEDIEIRSDGRLPRIIFLGDYIDRGDDARETLDFLVRLQRNLPDGSVEYLMGNHEAAALAFLSEPVAGASWLRIGGVQTLFSYGIAPPQEPFDDRDLTTVAHMLRAAMGGHGDFLASMPLLARSGGVVFAHAGIDPACELAAQTENVLLWGNPDFIKRGGVTGYRVVHGHYAAVEAVVTADRICVDTGAYYSGRLTAVRLDQNERLLTVTAFAR